MAGLLRELTEISYYHRWIRTTVLWGRQSGRLLVKLSLPWRDRKRQTLLPWRHWAPSQQRVESISLPFTSRFGSVRLVLAHWTQQKWWCAGFEPACQKPLYSLAFSQYCLHHVNELRLACLTRKMHDPNHPCHPAAKPRRWSWPAADWRQREPMGTTAMTQLSRASASSPGSERNNCCLLLNFQGLLCIYQQLIQLVLWNY